MITLSPDELAKIIADAVARGVAAALATQPKETARQARNRRYYESKRLKTSENVLIKTHSDDNVLKPSESDASPAPLPSPLSLSPTPPIPVPPSNPPSPSAKRASSGSPKNPAWRTENQTNADAANAVPVPADFPTAFAPIWQTWCAYRTAKACDARNATAATAWTVAAAEATLKSCASYAPRLGWQRIYDRFDEAIAGQWQGLNLSSIRVDNRPQKPATTEASAAPGWKSRPTSPTTQHP